MTHTRNDRRLVTCAMVLLVNGMLLVSTCRGDKYTVTNLGTLGGAWSFAYGLNNSGEVIGWSAIDNAATAFHAFSYDGAKATQFCVIPSSRIFSDCDDRNVWRLDDPARISQNGVG